MTLTELRELAERATPGPWAVFTDDYDKGTLFIGPTNQDEGHYYVTGNIDSNPDALLIAACSPETVKALIDAIPADPWFVCGGMIQCYSCGVKYEAGGVLGHHTDSCAWAALA